MDDLIFLISLFLIWVHTEPEYLGKAASKSMSRLRAKYILHNTFFFAYLSLYLYIEKIIFWSHTLVTQLSGFICHAFSYSFRKTTARKEGFCYMNVIVAGGLVRPL